MYGESDGWSRERLVASEVQPMNEKERTEMARKLCDKLESHVPVDDMSAAIQKWAKENGPNT